MADGAANDPGTRCKILSRETLFVFAIKSRVLFALKRRFDSIDSAAIFDPRKVKRTIKSSLLLDYRVPGFAVVRHFEYLEDPEDEFGETEYWG